MGHRGESVSGLEGRLGKNALGERNNPKDHKMVRAVIILAWVVDEHICEHLTIPGKDIVAIGAEQRIVAPLEPGVAVAIATALVEVGEEVVDIVGCHFVGNGIVPAVF